MKRGGRPRRKRKSRPTRRKQGAAGKVRKPAPMVPIPAVWE